MKKIMVALLALLLCFGLCACGSGGASDAEQVAEKIDEFIAENQSVMDELNEQFADTVEYSLQTEGTNLVFLAKYLFDVDADAMGDSALGNGDTYVQLYERLKQRTGSDDVKLVVRILNKDGETIHEEVIDENYTPTAAEEDTDTLEDFINSEDFQSGVASGSSEDVSISATVENGNTVVIVYQLTQTVDPAQYDALKAQYEGYFGNSSVEEAFVSVYQLLSSLYPDTDVAMKLRITDEADVTIYERALDFSTVE